MPGVYKRLKDAVLDCIKHVRFDRDARSVFKTERVQNVLDSVMSMIMRALELITQYYSQSFFSESSLVPPCHDSFLSVLRTSTFEPRGCGRSHRES